MRILSEDTDGIVVTELFKTIYQITRLHVPEVLYQYYSLSEDTKLNKLKLKTLSEG